jgi:hypothetical protein
LLGRSLQATNFVVTEFAELVKGKVRRIPLLSNTLNKDKRGEAMRMLDTTVYGVSVCLSKPLWYLLIMSA